MAGEGTMSARREDARAGREAHENAMLEAAADLFSQHGFAAVSVRDIAAAAGVSHALVHRYLGSKEEIYRAVLRRNENLIRDAGGDTEDLATALSLMLRDSQMRHRQYLRMVVQSALGGLPFDATMGRFPATERLVELAEQRAADAGPAAEDELTPRFVIAAIVSLNLGWAAIEPWILPATGLEDLDEETILAGLERVILGIAAQQLP
jgi:TetR/AcrR family transcriptional regulator, repressor for neighboring sulfatase